MAYLRLAVEYLVVEHLPFAGDGTVPGHRLGRHLEVRVGAVEEGLAALRQRLQHERGGGRPTVQRRPCPARRAAARPAVLHIEAATSKRRNQSWSFALYHSRA